MFRDLPPLNALRAFEAAARHLSFTKAAEELGVTPAAVSHQIKGLEDYLGVVLFQRLTRALRLSDAAQAALPVMREGFAKLAEASERLGAEVDSGVLTVSAGPSLAAKWLVPRLDSFRQIRPDLDLRLDANDELVDFQRDGVDIALRYGRGHYPGHRVDPLFGERFSPVCSPRLMAGPHPLREPGDLRHHTLLHLDWRLEDVTAPNWHMLLLAAGVEDIDSRRGARFNIEALAVQTAIEGHGVALASEALVQEDLNQGRLVRPFDLIVTDESGFSYFLVSPEARAEEPKIVAFRNWILAEVASSEAAAEGTPQG